jgi:hypothetical protein
MSNVEHQHDPKFSPWKAALTVVVVAFAATLVLVAGGGWLLDGLTPELKLPLLILLAVVALLGTISLVVIAFGIFRLTDDRQPLGLPEGSVRAIIALMLIVLFAAMTVFLIARLEMARATDPSVDATKQVLTILGTLVTAIASFYFGAQTVAAPGTSGTGTSGAGTSGGGTSGAGTSSTGTSGTGTSGTGTSGTGTSGTGTSGTGTSGTGTSGTGTSGTGTSGAGTAGTGTSNTGTSGTGTPGSDTSGTSASGTNFVVMTAQETTTS